MVKALGTILERLTVNTIIAHHILYILVPYTDMCVSYKHYTLYILCFGSETVEQHSQEICKKVIIYEGRSESKERLRIQHAQLLHCTRSVIWCVQ